MHVIAIDQGTTGTTTVLYNEQGQPVKKAYKEFKQFYPKPGWVEHDPEEIWKTVEFTLEEILKTEPKNIQAIGITNQRETTVVWDKNTGNPIYNAVVWQCRRTEKLCSDLKNHAKVIQDKTGLPLDAYFSGTKINWILNNAQVKDIHSLAFGTIDTWLIWKLTKGKVHATDYTNASRTLIYNIYEKKWDHELLKLFDIPENILPQVNKSKSSFGNVEGISKLKGIPICGVVGDQQAALFGQTCFKPGELKNTYGTGCFLMMNSGDKPLKSKSGLVTTLAVDENGNPSYALEGSIFIAGAAIQWLRDELKIINKADESEQAALSLDNNEGVYLVPAFVGLGAPYWDMQARGTIVGLTRGSGRNHLIRAALESMAYQSHDVIQIMDEEMNMSPESISVDGGAVANNFLMQFQADILGKNILRPEIIESTSLGAAYVAGLESGVWSSSQQLKENKKIEKTFSPKMNNAQRIKNLEGWKKAISQTLTSS